MIEKIEPVNPNCPECGRITLRNGVILVGNILTGEPMKPAARFDCPHCYVMISNSHIDTEWGWQQWEAQGNKRPATT